MKLLSKIYTLLLAMVLLAMALPARADEPIAGYVTRIRGAVQVENNTQRQAVQVGHALLLGSKLVTGADARLEVRMTDGTVLTLSERTEFVIEHVSGTTSADKGSLFELLKGAFRAITAQPEAPKKPLPTLIRTPVAVIGVRGTELWGGFNLLESGVNTLDVVMFDGKGVFVENSAGTVELLKGGDGTTVVGALAAPLPLKAWGEKKIKAARDSVAW